MGRIGTRFKKENREIAKLRQKRGQAGWVKSTKRRNARKKK